MSGLRSLDSHIAKIVTNIAFAKRLEDIVADDNAGQSLSAEICKEIKKALSIHDTSALNKRVDLDKQGTRLWNLASRLKNTTKDGDLLCSGKSLFDQCSNNRFTSTVRVFACLLLDCAQRCTQHSPLSKDALNSSFAIAPSNVTLDDVRVLRSFLRTSKHCLGRLPWLWLSFLPAC